MQDEFERLYENYHHSLFRYLFYMVRDKEAAEELVQEVYIKVFHSFHTFEGKSSEKTWLYSIARHVGIDWIRKQNRKKRKWLGFIGPLAKYEVKDPAPLPDEIVSTKEEVKHVYEAMEQCTPDQRQVIVLRYLESLSIKETADILGWSDSKVKTTQHRAVKKIKSVLEQKQERRGQS
ncbi:RNA polymerase, sigma subunit, SigX [Alteribacillus persepolensis]|uniref:RNA polymerase sigma factor n=1 Tax=Alteribacillus persepolensis TaxID=568899 RepID=A0A1G8FHE0_9BACI|nr:RNA polymerase sigma factor SigX [Alteribacillus persepolensis]SDH81409.1 RNA polymerase, sigma subunit, SigX [Alteribacillus persepolensis]